MRADYRIVAAMMLVHAPAFGCVACLVHDAGLLAHVRYVGDGLSCGGRVCTWALVGRTHMSAGRTRAYAGSITCAPHLSPIARGIICHADPALGMGCMRLRRTLGEHGLVP